MRVFVAGFALAMLTGCQSVETMSYAQKNALAQQIAKRCAAQGYADGHPQQRDCIAHEVNREVVTRRQNEQRRMAVAAAMGNVGAQMQANAATPVYRPPVTCTSRPSSSWVGGPVSQVRTTCY